MHQTDQSLVQKMQVDSDAIIINQCKTNEYRDFTFNGHKIRIFSFNETGVGISRNSALMRANADICLFADEDIRYYKDYSRIVLDEFISNPKADVIIFNIDSTDQQRVEYRNLKKRRLNILNSLRYGAARIAVRTNRIRIKNIYFSTLFGGGSKYSAGEDTLFIVDCLKKGLRIFSSNKTIGLHESHKSTWFEGYTNKYFYDKGALFCCMANNWAYFIGLYYCLKHYKEYSRTRNFSNAYRFICKGIKDMKRDTK